MRKLGLWIILFPLMRFPLILNRGPMSRMKLVVVLVIEVSGFRIPANETKSRLVIIRLGVHGRLLVCRRCIPAWLSIAMWELRRKG